MKDTVDLQAEELHRAGCVERGLGAFVLFGHATPPTAIMCSTAWKLFKSQHFQFL